MKHKNLYFVCIAALLCIYKSNAQIDTTVLDSNKTDVQKIKIDPKIMVYPNFLFTTKWQVKWDSTMPFLHQYHELQKNNLPFLHLGLIGSPHVILAPNFEQTIGIRAGLNPYSNYNFTANNAKLFVASIPFSQFNYSQGTGTLFQFHALHAQSFKRTNILAEVKSIKSLGYLPSNTNENNQLHRATRLIIGHHSKNEKWYFNIITQWNRGRRLETGDQDSAYIFSPKDPLTVFGKTTSYLVRRDSIWGSAIRNANSVYKNSEHILQINYFLTKQFFIFNNLQYNNTEYKFYDSKLEESEKLFYQNSYHYNTLKTTDSNRWQLAENRIGFGNVFKRFPISYTVNLLSQMGIYNAIARDGNAYYYANAIESKFNTDNNPKNKINGNLNAAVFLQGKNAGDFNIETNLDLNLLKNIQLSGKFKSQLYSPSLFQQVFSSNTLRWLNPDFKKTFVNYISVGASYKNTFVSVSANVKSGVISNYIFAADKFNLVQHANAIAFSTVFLQYQLRLKHLYLYGKTLLQSNSANTILPFPNLQQMAGIYLQKRMFKSRALLFRSGFDFTYTSKTNSLVYDPVTTMFTLQNYFGGTPKYQVGNYPILDYYLSGEIKTIQIYLKLEHINGYLANYGFNDLNISAVNYRMEPFRIRVGFIWKMYY